MNKKAKRYLKFEDAALQSSFLEQLRRSGIACELNRSGAVAFAEENANTIISAAHRVRDAQFPWYFLKWKTEREAARYQNILKQANIPFFVEQHESGTWLLVRRADRACHERLGPEALEATKKRRSTGGRS